MTQILPRLSISLPASCNGIISCSRRSVSRISSNRLAFRELLIKARCPRINKFARARARARMSDLHATRVAREMLLFSSTRRRVASSRKVPGTRALPRLHGYRKFHAIPSNHFIAGIHEFSERWKPVVELFENHQKLRRFVPSEE